MIFDTKQYVPLIYRSSRDYQALLKLLDIVLTTVKYETDSLINLYIPKSCMEEFLPILAEHIGYEYNYKDTVSTNRIIIDNFAKMIRNRGSEVGIKLACSLSLNSLNIIAEQMESSSKEGTLAEVGLAKINVFVDYVNGKLTVIYPQNETKVRHLIDWVRPVGMWCDELPGNAQFPHSDLAIYAYAKVDTVPFNTDQFSRVEWSEICNGMVAKIEESALPHTWSDVSAYTWEQIKELTVGEDSFVWEDFLEENPTTIIYITYKGDGGTFVGPNVISVYTGEDIVTLTDSDIYRGLDKLVGWQASYGEIYTPGQSFTVEKNTNFSLKAMWESVSQHTFLLDLDNVSDTINQLTIRPLFNSTTWHLMIEHKKASESTWEIVLLNKDIPSTTPLKTYTVIPDEDTTYGQYRITIGYDTITSSNFNVMAFTNSNIYDYAKLMDWSALEINGTDIFANQVNNDNIIVNNNYLQTFILPENADVLTMPKKFLCNCTKLNEVTFPNMMCDIVYRQDINGNYTNYFLYNMGIDNYKNDEFIIPASVRFVYADYDNYQGNYVTLFENFGSNNDLTLDCSVESDTPENTNSKPKVAFSLAPTSPHRIDVLTVNGNIKIYDINSNNSLNTIFIHPSCDLNDYTNTHNLANVASNLFQIVTDDYGATTRINNNQFSNGDIEYVLLGDAIHTFGEYTFCNLYNTLNMYIPASMGTIPKTAIQSNPLLVNIGFGTPTDSVIRLSVQGFHNLPNLTEVTIPDCIRIGTCFYNCSRLETVNLNNITEPDFQTMFVSCDSLTNITINANGYRVNDNILFNSNSTKLLWIPWGINEVDVGDNITTIGSYSFSGCPASLLHDYILDNPPATDIINQYTVVTLRENVTTIEEYAFNLTNIGKLTVYNANLDLSNLGGCDIGTIEGHINSTAHIYAEQHNITFLPLELISNNINGLINTELGTNILS